MNGLTARRRGALSCPLEDEYERATCECMNHNAVRAGHSRDISRAHHHAAIHEERCAFDLATDAIND